MQSDVTQFLENLNTFDKLYINKANILRWNLDENSKLTIQVNVTDMRTMKTIIMSVINLGYVNVNFNSFEQFLFKGIRLDTTTFYVTGYTFNFERLKTIRDIVCCNVLELNQDLTFRDFFDEGITIQDLQVYNNDNLVTFRFYFIVGVNHIDGLYDQVLRVVHIADNRVNKTFYFKEGGL